MPNPTLLDDIARQFAEASPEVRQRIRPGADHPQACYEQFVDALRGVGCIPSGGRCAMPLIVVITKCDALNLLKLIDSMPGASADDRAWEFLHRHGWPGARSEVECWFSRHRICLSGHGFSSEASAQIADIALKGQPS